MTSETLFGYVNVSFIVVVVVAVVVLLVADMRI